MLRAAKTTFHLVQQCQQALNDISTWHAVGLYWVPGHAGVRGNEIADRLARSGPVQRFMGPEPFLGVSGQNIRRKMKRWMEKLISGPNLATGARLLSFNRTQSRVVTGLLNGNNTLRRRLYIMGLHSKIICRRCGTEEETSVHILCECETLASLRHMYFIFGSGGYQGTRHGAIWNFVKGTGLL